ncbi:MAG: septum site-determining protein MinC [Bacillota bacterium]
MIQFKGSTDGIRLIIDQSSIQMDADDLYTELAERVAAINSFLSGAAIEVELATDRLTRQLADLITAALYENSDMVLSGISCRSDGEPPGVLLPLEVEDQETIHRSANGPVDWIDVHHGTVRGGQGLQSPRSLVVLGSVNPGGRVTALGNIYVMGNLQGVAHAGANGAENCWIYAAVMNPLQLRIGGHVARNAQGPGAGGAECAVVDGGQICVYPASRLAEMASVRGGLRVRAVDD